MIGTSWIEHETNETMLNGVNEGGTIMKIKLIGHQ